MSASPSREPGDRIRARTWVRATALGWLLGIPCIVLLALAGETVGIGGAQGLVGLGMGFAVGLLQGRAIRPILGGALPWMLATGVGFALPFLLSDLTAHEEWPLEYSLPWCVAIGGGIVGLLQALLLRQRQRGVTWWVAASLLGWSLAGAMANVANSLTGNASVRGASGALLFLLLVATGGVVLGLVSSWSLQRLTPR